MSKHTPLLDRFQIETLATNLYQKKKFQWLARDWEKPLALRLGLPTEATLLNNFSQFNQWQQHWRDWRGDPAIEWTTKRWNTLGEHTLPTKIRFLTVLQLVTWIDKTAEWQQLTSRYRQLTEQFPSLLPHSQQVAPLLEHYDEADFLRMKNLLAWLIEHPHSNFYTRQLPLAGIDSKWIEKRKGMVAKLLCLIQKVDKNERNFFELTGLKREPFLIRLRLLDERLRKTVSGIGDLTIPLEEACRLSVKPKTVFIVENLRTGLAFADLPDSIVIMQLGYAVEVLARIPWVQQARCFYWGDLDTHGFNILNQARSVMPNLQSVLMDASTLQQHKTLWGIEEKPHLTDRLDRLNSEEFSVYQHLCRNTFGHRIRLEQERIAWEYAWRKLEKRIH